MRVKLALASLVVSLLWFAGPSRWMSASLNEVRAHDLASQDIDDPIQAVLMATPEELPRGDDARRLAEALTRAVEMHEGAWLQVAWSALDETQRFQLMKPAEGAPRPRSRAHPQTPAELLELIDVLSAQAGSHHEPVPAFEGDPVDLATGDALAGLLRLAEGGSIRDDQVPTLLGCALQGVQAHESAPALVAEVLEGLAPSALARLEHAPPLQGGFGPSAALAIARLHNRQ